MRTPLSDTRGRTYFKYLTGFAQWDEASMAKLRAAVHPVTSRWAYRYPFHAALAAIAAPVAAAHNPPVAATQAPNAISPATVEALRSALRTHDLPSRSRALMALLT